MRRDGLETWFLRHLPNVLLAGVVPGALICALAPEALTRILSLAFLVGWALACVPPAILCLIVCAMKGPPRTADSYPLPDLD
jgi:hypothetical protein